MYRFGDGSPFPYDDNFLDILSAAIEACAAVFEVSADLDIAHERAREAKRDADEEVRRLTAMEKAIETALFPMKPSAGKNAPPSQQTAHRVLAMSRQAVAASKREVQQRADAIGAEPRNERSVERVREAMATLFEQQALPGTAWAVRWQAGGSGAHAEAAAQAGRFRSSYDLALEAPWNAPVKVSALVDQLRVELPRKRLFSEPRPGMVALEKCALVRFERSADRHFLVLRENPAKPSAGWNIVLSDPEQAGVIVTPIDAEGQPMSGAIAIDGEDAAALYHLGEIVSEALSALRHGKRRLRELRLGDSLLEQIGDPGIVGKALLTQLAPLIRQTRTKSRVPGELIVKRDIGDGRREELFIPRAALERRFAALPPEYRRFFDDAGLGREPTQDLSDLPDSGEVEPRAAQGSPIRVLTSPQTSPTVTLPAN
jgi:hypothetical protein